MVGAFREDFFIDYIDTEYYLRMKKRGLLSIVACTAFMVHRQGQGNSDTITLDYNPLRRYYRTRNGLILIKEYKFVFPLWVLKKIAYACYEYIITFATEKQKYPKIKNSLFAIIDVISKKKKRDNLLQ